MELLNDGIPNVEPLTKIEYADILKRFTNENGYLKNIDFERSDKKILTKEDLIDQEIQNQFEETERTIKSIKKNIAEIMLNDK